MKYKHFLIYAFVITGMSCTRVMDKSRKHDVDHTELDSIRRELAIEMKTKKIEYFIINVPDDQFGYYIMIDGQMYIEQKTIPAIEGNQGFKTREDAEKIAGLVIQKMKEGEIPPTISVEDLKAYNVIDK